MPADISVSLKDWSTTAGSNLPAGGTFVGNNLDDNLRALQAALRADVAARDTIASAATTDIGTKDAGSLDVTGTTTITSLGTVSAGIRKVLTFTGSLTLTHNATSLILPTAANLSTAAGDSGEFVSLGGGNWRCLNYTRASGQPISVQAYALSDLSAATADKTLSNGQFQQVWDWPSMNAGGKIGLHLKGTGSAAHTVLKVSGGTLSGTVLDVYGESTATSIFKVDTYGFSLQGVYRAAAGNGATCTIKAGSTNAFSANTGGTLNLYGGDGGTTGGGGLAGDVDVAPGFALAGSGTAKLRDYGTTAVVSASPTALTLSGTTKLVLDDKHVYIDNTNGTPSIVSGAGTGATIAGSDVCFEITIGTGSPTTPVVNFANTWPTAPQFASAHCSQVGANLYVTALSATQITINSNGTALSSGAKVRVLVLGLQ